MKDRSNKSALWWAAGILAAGLLWVGAAKPAAEAPPTNLSLARDRAKAAWDAMATSPPATDKAKEAAREALHYLREPGAEGYKFATVELKTGKVDVKEGWRTLASAKVSALEAEPESFKAVGGPAAVVSVHVPGKINMLKNNGDVYLASVEVSWRLGTIRGTVKKEVKQWVNRGSDFQVPLPVVADEIEASAKVATRPADAGKTVVEWDVRSANLTDSEENPNYYLVVVLKSALTGLDGKDLSIPKAFLRAASEILAGK